MGAASRLPLATRRGCGAAVAGASATRVSADAPPPRHDGAGGRVATTPPESDRPGDAGHGRRRARGRRRRAAEPPPTAALVVPAPRLASSSLASLVDRLRPRADRLRPDHGRSPVTRSTDLPAPSRSITPVPDAVQVPQQTKVVVDLAEGYEGRLVIDDVALPDDPPRRPRPTRDVEPGEQVDDPARRRVRTGQRAR